MVKEILGTLFGVIIIGVSVLYINGSLDFLDIINTNQKTLVKKENLLEQTDKRAKYLLDERIKVMYTDIITTMIEQDKVVRKRFLFIHDKSSEEISKKMLSLEKRYEKERRKIQRYCTHKSNNCLIQAQYNTDKDKYSEIHINLKYQLDEESQNFFNTVTYVLKTDKQWNPAKLMEVSDTRYYLQDGNWQDRIFHMNMYPDLSLKVDKQDVIQGHGWNAKI